MDELQKHTKLKPLTIKDYMLYDSIYKKAHQCLSEVREKMDIDSKQAWETCGVTEIF